MEELRSALEELYLEFGKEKTHEKILLKLSQILDELVVEKQREKYKKWKLENK